MKLKASPIIDSVDQRVLRRRMTVSMMMMIVMMISLSLASIETSSSYKPDTRKCCLLSEVLVEEGPGQRRCTEVAKIGGTSGVLNPKTWRGHELKVTYLQFSQKIF